MTTHLSKALEEDNGDWVAVERPLMSGLRDGNQMHLAGYYYYFPAKTCKDMQFFMQRHAEFCELPACIYLQVSKCFSMYYRALDITLPVADYYRGC